LQVHSWPFDNHTAECYSVPSEFAARYSLLLIPFF